MLTAGPGPSRIAEPANALDAYVAAAAAAYAARNPRSGEIARRAAHSLPGGNTRTSLWYDPFPLCMIRGEGSRLTDADDHRYIDFLGEFTAGIYGHSPAVIREAVIAALDDGINLSSHNRREGELAELIRQRFPSMALVRFTNSGNEANLMALAAARAWTGRDKVLVFQGGYHGGVLAFPPGGSRANAPYDFVVARYNDLDGVRTLIAEHAASLAAILVEPMQGAGGCVPGDPAFLAMLREAASQVGALLIFDEIQTSRLALGGRQSLLGLRPDLTTIGKFFGGGMAFGCFGGRQDVMGQFDPRRPDALAHAGTFNNNTLTMAAGSAALRHLLTAEALDALNAAGDQVRTDLLALFESEGAPFTASGLGSLMNIHPTGPADAIAPLRRLLFFDLAEQGIYIAPRGLIALSLCITPEDIAAFMDAMRRFLTRRRPLFA